MLGFVRKISKKQSDFDFLLSFRLKQTNFLPLSEVVNKNIPVIQNRLN